MTKRRVLVFPCGSEIGLEIWRSLRFSTHFEVFGASSVDDHGRFAFENYIPGLPFVGAPDFEAALNQAIGDHAIDLVIPAHDDVVLALAAIQAEGRLACKAVTSDLETCRIARSKDATYRRLEGVVPVPEHYASPAEAAYPAFVKPDVGQGSKGARIVRSEREAEALLAASDGLMLLEYLPGDEFTVDCFTDCAGRLLFHQGRERARISHGISVRSMVREDPRFGELAQLVNDALPFRGAWFFQVKARADGELALLEIAPRIAGTMCVSRARGVNLPLLSLFDALDMPVSIRTNALEVTVDRALQCRYSTGLEYTRAYLDLDDTLVIEGKVNLTAVAFAYQCRNEGIELILLTRHEADLETTLKQHRLEGLFDETIWLRRDEAKSAMIDPASSIFVDDSWAEREEVFAAHGIPVFDTHSLEVLLQKT